MNTMVNENLKVPKLRFGEFSGAWESKTLNSIAKFSKGKNVSKADVCEDGVFECIRYGELYTRYNETIDKVYSRTNLDAKDLIFSEANDIIIPASGESAIDIATASCLLRSGIALGGDLNIIKTKENGVFLSYYFNNKKRYEIASKAQGISVIHIYAEHLKSLHLNLPTIAEKEKIANYLSALDEKLNLLSEKEKNLSQYKKAMMQKLFAQEIRFKDDEGKEFKEWEEKKLGEVAEIKMGQSPDSNSYNEEGLGVPLIQGNADIKNRISAPRQFTTKATKFCEENDILFTVRAPVGYIGKANIRACIGRGVAALRPYNISDYIYQYLLFVEDKWASLSQGSTFTAINSNDLKQSKLPYPCVAEQEKIAQFLSAIDEKINAVQKQIAAMQEFKKAMLQQMFV